MNATADKSLLQFLQDQEEALLDQDVRRSETRLDELLADDFVEFGASGVRYDKPSIVGLLAIADRTQKLSLRDFNMIACADGFAAVTYICECRDEHDKLVRKSLRSSLWKKIAGTWQLSFHQGTKAEIDS